MTYLTLLEVMQAALREIRREKLKFARALHGIWKRGFWRTAGYPSFSAFCREQTPYSTQHCADLVRTCERFSDAEVVRYGFTALRVALRVEKKFGRAAAEASLRARADGGTVVDLEVSNGYAPSTNGKSIVSTSFRRGERFEVELGRRGDVVGASKQVRGALFTFELSGKRLVVVVEKSDARTPPSSEVSL